MFKNIIISMVLFTITQILCWFQLNTQFISENLKNNFWFAIVLGIPISLGFWLATKYSYNGFDEVWPGRLIGFGVGIVTYTILTNILLNESLSIKTITTLFLAVSLVLIQIFWRN